MIAALAIVGWLMAFCLTGVLILQSISERKTKPQLYQHFKGGVYEFDGYARDADDPMQQVVIYVHQQTRARWFRKSSEFFDEVEKPDYKGPRFRKL